MSLGTSRITNRGHVAVYTVPAGRRATVNTTILANSATSIGISANELGSYASTISVANPPTTQAFSNTGTGANGLGYSCAIDGNYAVVGTSVGTGGYIRVYFFDGTNWTLQQTINDPGTGNSQFAASVAIQGDRILVGAPYNDQDNSNQGRAYLYSRSGTTWSLASTYTSPLPIADQNFGFSLGFCGTAGNVYITAPFNNYFGSNEGNVFYYTGYTGLANYYTGDPGYQVGRRLAAMGAGRAITVYSTNIILLNQSNIAGNLGAPAGSSGFGSAFVATKNASTSDEYFAVRSTETGSGAAASGVIRIYSWSQTLLQVINNPSTTSGWATTPYFNSNSMAMMANGDLLTIAPGINPVMYYYTRSGNTWTLTTTATLSPSSPTATSVCGSAMDATLVSGTTAAGNAWSVPVSILGDYNVSSGFGAAYLFGSRTAAAGLADAVGFNQNFGTDRTSIVTSQTYERTGMVLEAGESLVVLNQNGGDIVAQVRGFEEIV